ncbi:uncharacterized protein LOC116679144 [Etheostoma spectabile]|uniref:uncharacterized protein LOC116679144 n=1 Tax=Etheostoma spectabile TaxID=54343 RepID=UPI0013AFC39C|nr:uncharacterized protein LOC116679144 [Etheostoma spectabile]
MLANPGQASSNGLLQLGHWLPTSIVGQKENSDLWAQALRWQIDVINATGEVLENVTKTLNWTVCNMQMIHAKLQQERFERILTSENPSEWRRIWNMTNDKWIKLAGHKTQCNGTMCKGSWTEFTVNSSMVVCLYQVLPVITTQGFWYLHMDGEWLDPRTNITYDAKFCEDTDKGMACRLQTGYHNPCLTASEVALCDWTREAPTDRVWQVGPQTLCVAAMSNHSQLPAVPFTGCVKDVYIWTWRNLTYRLTNYSISHHFTHAQWDILHLPWKISLDRFRGALERSTEIQRLVRSHRSNITSLMISTLIAKDEVVDTAQIVGQNSAHHWWDIFSGMSVTAKSTLVPPLLLLVLAICILTLCNFATCYYVRRTRQEVEWVIFQRMR